MVLTQALPPLAFWPKRIGMILCKKYMPNFHNMIGQAIKATEPPSTAKRLPNLAFVNTTAKASIFCQTNWILKGKRYNRETLIVRERIKGFSLVIIIKKRQFQAPNCAKHPAIFIIHFPLKNYPLKLPFPSLITTGSSVVQSIMVEGTMPPMPPSTTKFTWLPKRLNII